MTCDHSWTWDVVPYDDCGWRCTRCDHKPGEPPGYSPKLDRSHTDAKVRAVLADLERRGYLETSRVAVGGVARRARRSRYLDQSSIIMMCQEAMGLAKYEPDARASYYRRLGGKIVKGRDPRDRCPCGALAAEWIGKRALCRECRRRGDHA